MYLAPVRALALALVLGAACAAPAPPPAAQRPAPADEAGEALASFASAVEEGRWPEAWALLSARWRGRLTPASLAADYGSSGPVGRGAAARVLALLSAGARPEVRGRTATLPVGAGKAALLVEEEHGWKVDALE